MERQSISYQLRTQAEMDIIEALLPHDVAWGQGQPVDLDWVVMRSQGRGMLSVPGVDGLPVILSPDFPFPGHIEDGAYKPDGVSLWRFPLSSQLLVQIQVSERGLICPRGEQSPSALPTFA